MGNEVSSSTGGAASVGLGKDTLVSLRSRTVRVKKDIAVGGFGAVALAEDASTGELFVLKRQVVSADNDAALSVARNEIDVLRALGTHPNVTCLVDFNIVGDDRDSVSTAKGVGRKGDRSSLMRQEESVHGLGAGPDAPSDEEESSYSSNTFGDDDGFDSFSGGAAGKAHVGDGSSSARRKKAIGRSTPASAAPSISGAGALRNLVVFDILLEYADGGTSLHEADQYAHRDDAGGGGRTKDGGGLLSSLDASAGGNYMPEPRLLQLFRDALLGVQHMHSLSPSPITHYDLKPENLLLATGPNHGLVAKLCDFGSAAVGWMSLETEADRRAAEDKIERTTTLAYRAPELCDVSACLMSMEPGSRRVGPPADVWALGGMLYRLAYGITPFEEPNAPGVVQKMAILNGRYSFPSSNPYSKLTTGLIKACLTPDPSKRPTVSQLLEKSSQVPLFASLPPPVTAQQWQAFKEQATFRAASRPSALGGVSGSSNVGSAPSGGRQSLVTALGSAVSSVVASAGGNINSRPRAGSSASGVGGSNNILSTVVATLESAGESIQGRLMQLASAGKRGTTLDKQRWVLKATSRLPSGPKPKYVRKLLLDAWDSSSAGVTAQHLPSRPLSKHPIVAAKAALLTLKLLQLGPAQALSQLANGDEDDDEEAGDFNGGGAQGGSGFVPLFSTVARNWEASLPQDFVALARPYATLGSAPPASKALPLWRSFRGYRNAESEASTAASSATGYPLAAFSFAVSAFCCKRLLFARRYPSIGSSYCLDTLAAAITAANAETSAPGAMKQAVGLALGNLPLAAVGDVASSPAAGLELVRALGALLQTALFTCNVALAVDDLAGKANAVGSGRVLESGNESSAGPARAAKISLDRIQGAGGLGAASDGTVTSGASPSGQSAQVKPTDGQACATGCLGGLVEEAWAIAAAASLAFLALHARPGASSSPAVAAVSSQLQDLNAGFVNQVLPKYKRLQSHPSFRKYCEPLDARVSETTTTFLTELPHFQKLESAGAVELALALLSTNSSGSSSSAVSTSSAPAESAVLGAAPEPPSGPPLQSPYVAADHHLKGLLKAITDEHVASLSPQALQKRANTAACEPGNNANDRCAECGSPDTSWASVNLGILLCLGCSGAHRQLGVHISQVRSVTLDKWKKEWLISVLAIGNKRSNAYWEARGRGAAEGVPGILSPLPMMRPHKDAGMDERYKWTALKYTRATWAADESFAAAPSVADRAKAAGLSKEAITTPPHVLLPRRIAWLIAGAPGGANTISTPSFGVSSSSASPASFDFPAASPSKGVATTNRSGAPTAAASVSLDDFGPSSSGLASPFSPSAAAPAPAVSASDFDFADNSQSAVFPAGSPADDESDPFAISGSQATKNSMQLSDYELGWGNPSGSAAGADGFSGASSASSASAKPPLRPGSFATKPAISSSAVATWSMVGMRGRAASVSDAEDDDSEDSEGESYDEGDDVNEEGGVLGSLASTSHAGSFSMLGSFATKRASRRQRTRGTSNSASSADGPSDAALDAAAQEEIARLRQVAALRSVRTISSGALGQIATRAMSESDVSFPVAGPPVQAASARAATATKPPVSSTEFDFAAFASPSTVPTAPKSSSADGWGSADPFA